MKYLTLPFVLVLALLLSACSKDEPPKQVFLNEKLMVQVKEKNQKDLVAAGIHWITVSCNFNDPVNTPAGDKSAVANATGTGAGNMRTEIWYETNFGRVQILQDQACTNPQNLIEIGYQEENRDRPDYYKVDTARDYDYELVNGIIQTVLQDIKQKGSKL